MGAPTTSRPSRTDTCLIAAVRRGDRSAFADLYVRYSPMALRFASRLLGSAEGAEDLVAEAFVNVLGRLLVGGGPTVAFHSYLLTTIRRTIYKQWSAERRIDRQAAPAEAPVVETDPLVDRLDVCLVVRAFRTLTDRWQAVLWYLEVQNMSTADVAGILGIQPNAVAALAFRAREALRLAYVQMHVNTDVDGVCREVTAHLAQWLSGRLHRTVRLRMQQHVDACDRCSHAAAEVVGLVTQLGRTTPTPDQLIALMSTKNAKV